MKISHRWLTEFVALDASWTPERVSDTLTDLGIEVEHIENQAAALKGFVTGHVLTCEKHPKADKLHVCSVDVGDGTNRTIVCGAPNVAAGQTVCVALEGAIVPNGGYAIERRALRGIESQGMLCSLVELNLGDDHSGIHVLAPSLPAGMPLAQALGVDDVIYEIAVTPNRADAVSHLGVARELAAKGAPRLDRTPPVTFPPIAGPLTVDVQASTLCPRYMARRITDVTIGPSPAWLQDRLTSIGLRPRNVVVDITNYVLMECGQPLHAFDGDKLTNNAIVVRRATEGESFVTLDSKQRTLSATDVMICDAVRPIAIAGVMGGENSEIDDRTHTVVLESATFHPSSIRKTAKRLGLNTDASYRFERGVDVNNLVYALDRATQMICELAGGKAAERIDVYPNPQPPITIAVRYAAVRSLVGMDVTDAEQRERMRSIGCDVEEIDAHSYRVTVPSWRVDMALECDVAEEVARLVGYDNIPPATHARVSLLGAALPAHLRAPEHRARVRTFLVDQGFHECYTAVQTSPERAALNDERTVVLKNPLGLENSQFRTSIIPSLCTVAGLNLRNGQDVVRVFECGKTFRRADAPQDNGFSIIEREHVTALITGQADAHWSAPKARPVDLYDMRGTAQAMLQACGIRSAEFRVVPDAQDTTLFTQNRLDVMLGATRIGTIGEVLPTVAAMADIEKAVYAFEIDLRSMHSEQAVFAAVGAYPTVRRDVAFVVDDATTAADLLGAIRTVPAPLLRSADVFDVYRDQHLGADKKSIGIAMTFRSDERTLVDAEVDDVVRSVINAAASATGATVRGTTV